MARTPIEQLTRLRWRLGATDPLLLEGVRSLLPAGTWIGYDLGSHRQTGIVQEVRAGRGAPILRVQNANTHRVHQVALGRVRDIVAKTPEKGSKP